LAEIVDAATAFHRLFLVLRRTDLSFYFAGLLHEANCPIKL